MDTEEKSEGLEIIKVERSLDMMIEGQQPRIELKGGS
ncbi:hypothetical protein LINPERHAP2_LOCUS22994 [Linum perenne]